MTIEKIFKENYAMMVKIAAKYSPIYAEDIALDAFAKFIPLYREKKIHPSKINHWLCVSVKHLAIDFQRKEAVERRNNDRYYLDQDFENDIIEPTVLERIIQAIQKSPGKRGDILRMSFLQGFSIAEIAHRLGGTSKTIYTLRLRGCQDIARQLK